MEKNIRLAIDGKGGKRVMGLNYHIRCDTCDETSFSYEYSVVGYIEPKHPHECVEQVKEWTEFLVRHSGHTIKFVDSHCNETNPARITGAYVLGLT